MCHHVPSYSSLAAYMVWLSFVSDTGNLFHDFSTELCPQPFCYLETSSPYVEIAWAGLRLGSCLPHLPRVLRLSLWLLWLNYNVSQYTYFNVPLEFIEVLRYIKFTFSLNWGPFQPFFLSVLFLSCLPSLKTMVFKLVQLMVSLKVSCCHRDRRAWQLPLEAEVVCSWLW